MSECGELRQFLPARLGELQLADAGRLRAHLASCGSCAAEAQEYREIGRALAALREQMLATPPGSVEDVLAAVAAHQDARRRAGEARVVVAVSSAGALAAGIATLIVANVVQRKQHGRSLATWLATSWAPGWAFGPWAVREGVVAARSHEHWERLLETAPLRSWVPARVAHLAPPHSRRRHAIVLHG